MFEQASLRRSRAASAAAALILSFTAATAVQAQSVTAPGYVHAFVTLPAMTQSCVAIGPRGTFVGQGPGFTGNAQSIAFVTDVGGVHTVISGFNSISDCAYDGIADVLYVSDNALELSGAVTGDTVFAIPTPATASGLVADDFELVVAGSLPNAANLAIAGNGDVFVSSSTGGNNGSVRKISGGALSAFIPNGLDFAAGILFESNGDLLVAETRDSFDTQISRYDSTGAFVELVSGPGFDHGSYDLASNHDGRVLVSGAFAGPLVSLDPADGSLETLADGFNFATALEVDAFTGRIELVSSSFAGENEDFRLHQLVPIARLAADGGAVGSGKAKKECVSEFYGVELSVNAKGKPTKLARCSDGAACDADGVFNDICTFRFGVCLNVDDDRIPACSSVDVTEFELKKAKPPHPALSLLSAAVTAALPVSGSQCFFTDGVTVPLRTTKSGALKAGKQFVKLKTRSATPSQVDVDVVQLVCEQP